MSMTPILRMSMADFMCCFVGMALGVQMALLLYSPSSLQSGCGPSLESGTNKLDLACGIGMFVGTLLAEAFCSSRVRQMRWLALIASLAAMPLFHPPELMQTLLAASSLAALEIALLMAPAMLAGHGLVALGAIFLARGRQTPSLASSS